MGCCFSAHKKPRRRRRSKVSQSLRGRGARGSANFVIPVSGTSLENSAHRYEFGKNAKKRISGRGTGNAFLIEKPSPLMPLHGSGNGHLRHPDDTAQLPFPGSPSSRGSKYETFFDSANAFNSESDDEYMSVTGDFPSSAGDSFSYAGSNAPGSKRHSFAHLQVDVSKVDDWMAGASPMGSLSSPHLESESKRTPFGVRNGIAALAGSPKDSVGVHEKSLKELSPGKSFQMRAVDNKGTPGRHKWERTVSALLKRKQSGSDTSPSQNAAIGSPLDSGEATKSVDHKSMFEGRCLPRLLTTMPTTRSRSVSPLGQRKKNSMTRFSFRRRSSADQHDDHDSSRYYVDRPFGGSQVSHCSPDKPVDGCWSEVLSSQFKIRGKHFVKDKRKFSAPNFSAFVPFGVDLLMSARKIDHIAQYVELPFQELGNDAESLPGVFVVNIQLPLYPPSIFMAETDGEGLSLVLYFKLADEFSKNVPPYFKDILKKFVNNETEKVKGFVGDSTLSFRDRLKVVARCVNPDEVPLSAAEKKLVTNYNEKPILSRPQHRFHKGTNYFEVDLDVHRFSYIARKGFDTFRDRVKNCVLDIGFTIQGTRPEELPEQILAAVRLHKIDFGDYKILHESSSAVSVKSDDTSGFPSSP